MDGRAGEIPSARNEREGRTSSASSPDEGETGPCTVKGGVRVHSAVLQTARQGFDSLTVHGRIVHMRPSTYDPSTYDVSMEDGPIRSVTSGQARVAQ